MKDKSKYRKNEESKTTFTRRRFCEAGASALAMALVPAKSLASIGESRFTRVPGFPTLDELGTEWLDCSQLGHMPLLSYFHEMAACAPDRVGVNFLPGGQLYGDESVPRWPIYYSLPLCGMTIDDRSYESTHCRWFDFQAVRGAQVGDLDVVTTNRMVIEDTVVMWRGKFTNNGVDG